MDWWQFSNDNLSYGQSGIFKWKVQTSHRIDTAYHLWDQVWYTTTFINECQPKFYSVWSEVVVSKIRFLVNKFCDVEVQDCCTNQEDEVFFTQSFTYRL